MHHSLASLFLAVGVAGSLALVAGSARADTSCGLNTQAAYDAPFDARVCDSSAYSGTNAYDEGTCPAFVTEWDGTTANRSGTFTVGAYGTPTNVTQADCPGATVAVSVFGLELEVDNGRVSTFWANIGTQTTQGVWNAEEGVCTLTALVSFSDTVPGSPAQESDRYEDIKVAAQAYMYPNLLVLDEAEKTTARSGAEMSEAPAFISPIKRLPTYLPVNVVFQNNGCTE